MRRATACKPVWQTGLQTYRTSTRREHLGRGNTRDPLESYRELRGRDAVIEPLLERRGLKEGTSSMLAV